MNPNYWHQLWKNKKVKYIREIHSKNTPKIQTSTFFQYHLLCFSNENSPIHFLASRSKKRRILDSSRKKKKLKMSCFSTYKMTWISTTYFGILCTFYFWSFQIVEKRLWVYYRVVDRLKVEARPIQRGYRRKLHFLCSYSLFSRNSVIWPCLFINTIPTLEES